MENERLQSPNTITDKVGNRGLEQRKMLKVARFLRRNFLLIATSFGIVLGVVIGFSVRPLKPSDDVKMWIGMPGEIFMRLLKMMILPLVICSVISGTASLNPKSNGKISVVAIAYIIVTNGIASLLGLILFLVIRPGRSAVGGDIKVDNTMLRTQDIFADLIRNLVPDNIVEACFRQAQTQYTKQSIENMVDASNSTHMNDTVRQSYTISKTPGKTDGANIIGLIVVCMSIGIATNKSREKGKFFLKFFTSATEVVLIILRWQLWFTPIGVCSLIAVSLADIEDLAGTFAQIGMLVLTVFVGIVIHQVVVMPLVLFVLTRRNPFRYLFSFSRAWMIGFATTSTAVTIPEMLNACEVNKIDKRVSRFVVPFSVTLNADGSAIYITVSALFIATITGNALGTSGMILVVVLTTVAALAIPSVPSAGIVTLMIILTSLHLPANEIGYLFAVEWFLDRIRTSSNVLSHTVCAAVTYHFCKADLPPEDFGSDTNIPSPEHCDMETEIQMIGHVDYASII